MRGLLIVLLVLGAIAGFASGFGHRWYGYGYGYGWHPYGYGGQEAFERHVAELCVDAARRASPPAPSAPATP